MEDIIRTHISKTPGVCGGRACIAGHRVRVMDIVVWHEMRGYSPDEVVGMFPGISLADVHAALAYYFDNRAEIESDFRNDEEWERLGAANGLPVVGKAASVSPHREKLAAFPTTGRPEVHAL